MAISVSVLVLFSGALQSPFSCLLLGFPVMVLVSGDGCFKYVLAFVITFEIFLYLLQVFDVKLLLLISTSLSVCRNTTVAMRVARSLILPYLLQVFDVKLPWLISPSPSVYAIAVIVGTTTVAMRVARFSEALILALETEKEASAAKSLFVANVSHELRTPLTSIIGWTDMILKSYTLSLDLRSKMEMIQKSGESLLSLVNEILDFSKVGENKLQFYEKTFNFQSLIEEITKSNAIVFGENVKFISKRSLGDIENVIGDPHRISQCITNVLSNAAKFTKSGNVTITCAAEHLDDNLVQITVQISDTGIGMSKETLSNLFIPFVQGDSSISKEFGGTGLGLALAKKLLTAMNGTVGVSSSLGKGTTFTLTFQVKKTNSKIDPPKIKMRITAKSIHVLVVDDNLFNRHLATEMLSKLKHSCDAANSGKEAICKITARKYDLILMDIMMPGMNGYETANALRNMGILIPIVAITACADDITRKRAMDSGIVEVISKPFTMEQLNTVIDLQVHMNDQRARGVSDV